MPTQLIWLTQFVFTPRRISIEEFRSKNSMVSNQIKDTQIKNTQMRDNLSTSFLSTIFIPTSFLFVGSVGSLEAELYLVNP